MIEIYRVENPNENPIILVDDGVNKTAFPVGFSTFSMQSNPSDIASGRLFTISTGGANVAFKRSIVSQPVAATDNELFDILVTMGLLEEAAAETIQDNFTLAVMDANRLALNTASGAKFTFGRSTANGLRMYEDATDPANYWFELRTPTQSVRFKRAQVTSPVFATDTDLYVWLQRALSSVFSSRVGSADNGITTVAITTTETPVLAIRIDPLQTAKLAPTLASLMSDTNDTCLLRVRIAPTLSVGTVWTGLGGMYKTQKAVPTPLQWTAGTGAVIFSGYYKTDAAPTVAALANLFDCLVNMLNAGQPILITAQNLTAGANVLASLQFQEYDL